MSIMASTLPQSRWNMIPLRPTTSTPANVHSTDDIQTAVHSDEENPFGMSAQDAQSPALVPLSVTGQNVSSGFIEVVHTPVDYTSVNGRYRRGLKSCFGTTKDVLFGEQPLWQETLDSWCESDVKYKKRFAQLVDFADLSLRGAGQCMLCNNSISGAFFVTAMFVADPWIGLCGVIGLLAATLTGVLLLGRQACRNGLMGVNGVLAGLAIAAYVLHNQQWQVLAVPMCVFAAVISSCGVIAFSAMTNYDLPALQIPFNIVAYILLASLYHFAFLQANSALMSGTLPTANPETALPKPPNGAAFGLSILHGVSAIQMQTNAFAGILLLAGALFCSPLRMLALGFGALLGSGLGAAFGIRENLVYSGVFGVNVGLTLAAVPCTFFKLSARSCLLAFVASLSTFFVTTALLTVLMPTGLPVLTLPFCLVTLACLVLKRNSNDLKEMRLGTVRPAHRKHLLPVSITKRSRKMRRSRLRNAHKSQASDKVKLLQADARTDDAL